VDLGVDYVQVKQYSDAGTGMPMHFDMNRYDEITDILKHAESLENRTTKIIIKWHALEESKKITMEKCWSFDRCVDLPFLFQVSGNGKCYPCGFMFNKESYCYGDLLTQSLYDILHSRRYWEVVDKIASKPVQKICDGQCRHSCSNEFMHKFLRAYNGSAKEALVSLAGSEEQYNKLKSNPPDHLSFI
jgi:sulfatase maturation enzyme AslB (radical SAM superfamily)